MIGKKFTLYRVLMTGLLVMIAGGIWLGVTRLIDLTTVRYQAVGVVVDGNGMPLSGVEVLLLLTPPPAGEALDRLFELDGSRTLRHGKTGVLKRRIGPVLGLSGSSGAFVVRVTGRTGAARAIRLGIGGDGRPPFDRAWIVLRRDDAPDVTRTISLFGWHESPQDWGKFANRLPKFILR